MNFIIVLLLVPTLTWAKSFLPSSFSANFEESFISLASGREKKSFGKMDYKFPGQIRFEKTSPDQSTFVSNQEKSWYYVPPFVPGEMGQVTIQKSNKLPLSKFLDSLKDGVENSKYFSATKSGKNLELLFKPQYQKEMTLKKVVLVTSKDLSAAQAIADFEKMTLEYVDGRKVDLRLIDLKQDVSFDDNHFTFKVPEKTKISQ